MLCFYLFGYIINSLFYGLCVVVGFVIINGMVGYVFVKLNFNGKRVLFGFLLVFLIVLFEIILIL